MQCLRFSFVLPWKIVKCLMSVYAGEQPTVEGGSLHFIFSACRLIFGSMESVEDLSCSFIFLLLCSPPGPGPHLLPRFQLEWKLSRGFKQEFPPLHLVWFSCSGRHLTTKDHIQPFKLCFIWMLLQDIYVGAFGFLNAGTKRKSTPTKKKIHYSNKDPLW